MAKKQPRNRNPVAHHLFIHRGGVHEKSNSAKRQEDKRQLRKLVSKGEAGYPGLAERLFGLGFPAQHMLVAGQ